MSLLFLSRNAHLKYRFNRTTFLRHFDVPSEGLEGVGGCLLGVTYRNNDIEVIPLISALTIGISKSCGYCCGLCLYRVTDQSIDLCKCVGLGASGMLSDTDSC